MQRRQRRMSSRQRNPRAARNPAYQIKSRYHLAPENPAEGNTETWDLQTETPADESQWQRPETLAEPVAVEPTDADEDTEIDEPEPTDADEAEEIDDPEPSTDPEETAFQPEIQRPEDDEEVGHTAEVGAVSDEDAGETPEPIAPALVTVPVQASEPAEDFSTYVRKIEEAAARSRAERRGTAMSAHRPAVNVSHHPAVPARTYRQAASGRRQAAADARAGGRGGRGGGVPPTAQKPFFRRRKTWLFILALLVIVPVLIVSLYAANILRLGISAYQEIHTEPEDRVRYVVNAQGTPEPVSPEQADSLQPNWGENDVFNIVLMGIDNRNDDAEAVRSDTIIVVNVDPGTKEVAMMSIPRDLWVYIPGFGNEKMNAAYAIGDANQETIPGGGPTLVAQTIEANFNIPIHYYATVDFAGFQQIVDTVGGVIVDVQTQLSDNLYPTEDLRLTRIYFSSGIQHLDGKEALEYVRTRHADSDLARGQRQQQVLMAIRERAIVRDLITRAPELIEGVSDTVRTDLDFNQLLALANLGRDIDPANIARVDLWQEGILTEHFPEEEGDPYYLEANWVRIHQLQAEFFEIPEPQATPTPDAVAEAEDEPADDPPTATATVQATEPDFDTPIMVENGTDVEALAGHTTQFLFDEGFTAVWASDAEVPTDTTVIYDSSANPLTAEYLADLLDLSHDAIVPTDGNGDITIVIGGDFPSEQRPTAEP